MVLAHISELFFLQLAFGTALSLVWIDSQGIGKGFFILNTILAVVSGVIAFIFHLSRLVPSDEASIFIASMLVLLLLGAIAEARSWQASRQVFFLVLAALLGMMALSVDVRTIAPPVSNIKSFDCLLRLSSFLLGGFLVGHAIVGMNLGHWYLVSKGLSFDLLERASRLFIVLVLARGIMLGLTLATYWVLPGAGKDALALLFSAENYLVFFLMRLLWGLLGPFVLSVLVYRCVEIKSNTSATGLMYVAVVSLLIGEVMASYLGVLTAVPV